MVLQETYEVYDCLKYDIATIDNHNDIWTTRDVSLTRSSENSNISETTTGTDGHIYVEISKQCVIEFDVQLISTNYSLSFYQLGQYPNSSTRLENNLLVKNGDWHHMKLELNNDKLFVSSPETSETKTLTLTNFDSSLGMYFRFRTINGITGINFKNFVVYPI